MYYSLIRTVILEMTKNPETTPALTSLNASKDNAFRITARRIAFNHWFSRVCGHQSWITNELQAWATGCIDSGAIDAVQARVSANGNEIRFNREKIKWIEARREQKQECRSVNVSQIVSLRLWSRSSQLTGTLYYKYLTTDAINWRRRSLETRRGSS